MPGVLQVQSLNGGGEERRERETYKVYTDDRMSPADSCSYRAQRPLPVGIAQEKLGWWRASYQAAAFRELTDER